MKKNNLFNLGLLFFLAFSLVQNSFAQDEEDKETRTGVYYEYGEGLRAKTDNDNIDLTLNLYSKFQVGVTDTSPADWWGVPTGTKLYIPQTRLILNSDFMGGIVNFYGEVDMSGVEDRELYRDGHRAFVPREVSLNITPVENITLKFGQWWVPSGLEAYNYDEFRYNMESISIFGNTFGYLPELGVGIETNFAGYNFVFGVFDGHNISERKNETKTDYKLAALLSKTIFGEYDRSTSSDIDYSEEAALDVGIYGVYDKGKWKDGDVHFNDQRIGADIGYKHVGFSVELDAAYSYVSVKKEQDYSTFGTTAKTGYFILPKQLEGVLRFSWLNFNHNEDGMKNAYEPAVGINYYIIGENLRLGTMFSYINTEYRDKSSDNDTRWLTTLVVKF